MSNLQKKFECTVARGTSKLVCKELPQQGHNFRAVVNHRRRQNTQNCLCELSRKQLSNSLVDMRLVWAEHVLYTRLAVEQVVTDSPLAGDTVQGLYNNQIDLGNNLAIFYCQENGTQYADILRRHIDAAVAVLTALVSGVGLPAAQAAALANAREFAQFWADINRFANEEEVFEHMQHHILTLVDLMNALIAENAAEVVRTQDIYSAATRELSEYLARVVRRQWRRQCNDESDKTSKSSSSCSKSRSHH